MELPLLATQSTLEPDILSLKSSATSITTSFIKDSYTANDNEIDENDTEQNSLFEENSTKESSVESVYDTQDLASHHTSIKDFILIRTIGIGSLARVHLSKSRINQQFYAIKSLEKKTILNNKQYEHVKDEFMIMKLLQTFKNPFILNCDNILQDQTHLFLILDYLEGGDLFTLIHYRKSFTMNNSINQQPWENNLKLSISQVSFYTSEILLGLEFLHSNKIIHRDLNPENVVIDGKGHIKLIDFGLSKQLTNSHPNTRTFCGKSDYMSPEIILGKKYDEKIDIWALTIILYEMLFGYPPFMDKKSTKQTYQNILALKYNIPSWFGNLELLEIFKNMFQLEINDRLQNVKEFKKTQFFNNIDWDDYYQKKIIPPFIPNIELGKGEDKYFDRYPEDHSIVYGLEEYKKDDLFKDFS